MADRVKVPPHSDEAEEAVIGSILIDANAISQVAEFLVSEHFYSEANGAIYKAMLELYQNREPIDVLTISQRLKKEKGLSKAGGVTYLTEVVNKVPTSANVEAYANLVKDLATRRSLIAAAGKIAEVSFDEGRTASEALDKAEQEIFSLAQRHLRQVFV